MAKRWIVLILVLITTACTQEPDDTVVATDASGVAETDSDQPESVASDSDVERPPIKVSGLPIASIWRLSWIGERGLDVTWPDEAPIWLTFYPNPDVAGPPVTMTIAMECGNVILHADIDSAGNMVIADRDDSDLPEGCNDPLAELINVGMTLPSYHWQDHQRFDVAGTYFLGDHFVSESDPVTHEPSIPAWEAPLWAVTEPSPAVPGERTALQDWVFHDPDDAISDSTSFLIRFADRCGVINKERIREPEIEYIDDAILIGVPIDIDNRSDLTPCYAPDLMEVELSEPRNGRPVLPASR